MPSKPATTKKLSQNDKQKKECNNFIENACFSCGEVVVKKNESRFSRDPNNLTLFENLTGRKVTKPKFYPYGHFNDKK